LGRSELLERARAALLPVLTNLGYELIDLAVVVSHGRRTLRVFIEKPGGFTVADCARASKAISPVLDGEGIFRGRYFLEVSSPGAERKLRTRDDFSHFIGRKAKVRLRQPVMGVDLIEGRIERFQDDMLELRPEGAEPVAIPFGWVLSANLCL
jgi:ribosome maturation factor RimP